MLHAFLAAALVFVAGAIPAHAASPFDGTYQGITKLVRSTISAATGSGGCGGNAQGTPAVRRIVDGKVKMPWGTNEYEVPVSADGTINGTAAVGTARITVNGKITGNGMVIDYASQSCFYRWEGSRR